MATKVIAVVEPPKTRERPKKLINIRRVTLQNAVTLGYLTQQEADKYNPNSKVLVGDEI